MRSVHRAFPSLSQKLDLRRHLATVKPELEQIEERLDFRCRNSIRGSRVMSATRWIATASGFVRRWFCWRRMRAEKSTPQHLDLAVMVELIHLATLVHDDIMDGATKRRGKPTAFAKWGAEISVLLGDCLFCHALKLSSGFDDRSVIGGSSRRRPMRFAAARFCRRSAGSI